MQVRIKLPFFPGFDDEAHLSLYEHPDPEVWAIEVKLSEIQEKFNANGLSYSDLTFNQKDYERAAKTAWIEEWGKSAPKDVVESVAAEAGGRLNVAWAIVELKEGWQEVVKAFMQDNETWLKENCGQEHYLESQDFENWPKYLFEDYDGGAIADMIGLMMLIDYDDIDDVSYDLIAGALNNIDIRSYVFLTEKGLIKLVESDGNEQDEEIRILSNVKKWYEILTTDCSDGDSFSSLIDIDKREEYLDNLQTFVEEVFREKYRKEWYRNYLGTKKLTFDGPNDYTGDSIISDNDISDFIGGCWDEFLRHRLMTGHTERQERFTALMRNYPLRILDWLRGDWNDEVIPYHFYEGLAKGGEYELYGCTKEEFIDILRNKTPDEKYEDPEYASVLEEEYGIGYAVDYIIALDWRYWYNEVSCGTADFIDKVLYKAAVQSDNTEALKAMGFLALVYKTDDESSLDLSIDMYARLAAMWKKGLIDDGWMTDDDGLASVFSWEWGEDSCWDDDDYPEDPDEDRYRIWLLKLLGSGFAYDIAGYLKPYLELVLEREENHDWENGKKAIRAFLERTWQDG